jgi:hypothetical protein
MKHNQNIQFFLTKLLASTVLVWARPICSYFANSSLI